MEQDEKAKEHLNANGEPRRTLDVSAEHQDNAWLAFPSHPKSFEFLENSRLQIFIKNFRHRFA